MEYFRRTDDSNLNKYCSMDSGAPYIHNEDVDLIPPKCTSKCEDPPENVESIVKGSSHLKHICALCQKEYKSKVRLQSHILSHELMYLQHFFECDHCKRKFTTKANLRQHIQIHIVESKFGCDVCKKQFTLEKYLKQHIIMHETNPDLKYKFVCNVCKKKFIFNAQLDEHIILNHETNSDLKYKYGCIVCGKKI